MERIKNTILILLAIVLLSTTVVNAAGVDYSSSEYKKDIQHCLASALEKNTYPMN